MKTTLAFILIFFVIQMFRGCGLELHKENYSGVAFFIFITAILLWILYELIKPGKNDKEKAN